MEKDSEQEKVLETLFDSDVSEILAELEDGEKELGLISQKLNISEDDILQRLSFLIDNQYVLSKIENGKKIISADHEKLQKVMESERNFHGVVDGLTEMDSYLN